MGAKLAATISTGEYESRRVEFWVEMDLPSGVAVPEAIDNLHATLEEKIAEAQETIKRSRSAPASSISSQKGTTTLTSASSKPEYSTPPPATLSSTTYQPRPQQQESPPAEEIKAKDGTVLATVVRKKDVYVVSVNVTITESTGSWKNFLVGGTKRILPSVAEKHLEFHYTPIFEKGVLSRLELSGLNDGLWKEVKSPIAWALDRARETQ